MAGASLRGPEFLGHDGQARAVDHHRLEKRSGVETEYARRVRELVEVVLPRLRRVGLIAEPRVHHDPRMCVLRPRIGIGRVRPHHQRRRAFGETVRQRVGQARHEIHFRGDQCARTAEKDHVRAVRGAAHLLPHGLGGESGPHREEAIDVGSAGHANGPRRQIVELHGLLGERLVPDDIDVRHDVHRALAGEVVPAVHVADRRDAEAPGGPEVVGLDRRLGPDRGRHQHHVRIEVAQQRHQGGAGRAGRLDPAPGAQRQRAGQEPPPARSADTRHERRRHVLLEARATTRSGEGWSLRR